MKIPIWRKVKRPALAEKLTCGCFVCPAAFPVFGALAAVFSKTVCKGFFGVPFYADMGITAVLSFLRKLAAAVFVLTDGRSCRACDKNGFC